MSIRKAMKDAEHPYAMVSKSWVNDQNLGWKAKGIMVYLISKPDTWKVRERDLIRMSREGRCAVRSALLELQKEGYIRILRKRGEKGWYAVNDYEVYEEPNGVRFSNADNRTSSKNEFSK